MAAALSAFLFIVLWFMDFVWTLRGIVFLVFLFVATLLLVCLIKIYQSGDREKKYSKLFIKNQRLSLAIFAVENFALCPIIVLWIASIVRNKVNMSSLLVDNFGVFLVCLLVFAACYFLKKRSHKSRRAYQMNGKIKKTLSGLCSILKNISWPRSNARSSARLMRFEKIPIDSR